MPTKANKKVTSKDFGRRLKKLRQDWGFDEEQLGKETKLGAERIAKIEDGADFSIVELQSIARAYEYTTGGLVARLLKG